MEPTNTTTDPSFNELLPSLVIWKHNWNRHQDMANQTPQIFQDFVEAKPLDADMGVQVKWIITKTSDKLRKDKPFPIIHHFETDGNGEDVELEIELDEEHPQERFTMGMLSHIYGFHGKYALIAIKALDLEPKASFYPLYWIDSDRIDIPMKLLSKAYHSRLKYPFFTLHSV